MPITTRLVLCLFSSILFLETAVAQHNQHGQHVQHRRRVRHADHDTSEKTPDKPNGDEKGDEKGDKKKDDAKDKEKRFISHHELTTAEGESFAYTATAGEIFLRDKKGKKQATIFSIAYTKDGVDDAASRPVAFVFNGGPGSSSVWLHLGLLGPKRVDVPSDGTGVGAPPYRLKDNPRSLLSVADLVFVDPVGTGYSHALGEEKDENYWGVDEDSRSVAQFIRNYITENKRWNSPKYLIGESYGTIRASLLVRDLQGGFNSVGLNGIVLVAPALDTRFILGPGTDIPFVTFLPAFAATAWYHDALPHKPTDLRAFLREVTDFASKDYLTALFEGDAITEESKKRVLDKLHEYTGLSRNYLQNARLRVSSSRFMRELLRDRGLVVGRLDSRYTGTEPDNVGEYPSNDPSGYGVGSAFVATMNQYLLRELKVEMEREYTILNLEANGKWKRPGGRGSIFSGFLNVIPHLARGMASNKDLRVFVANGYYDLTTTFFASEYMFNHSGIDAERVTMKHYEAGHMMYVHEPSFEQLAGDLREFVEAGSP